MDYNRTDFGIIFFLFYTVFPSFPAAAPALRRCCYKLNSIQLSTFNFRALFSLRREIHKKARAIQFLLIYSG